MEGVELCHPELLRPRQFRQAFPQQWHLKQAKVGSATIEAHAAVAAAWKLSTGKGTTIADIDTGVGMPQADMQKAFQPYFTTKEVGKGTGLGLFLSRETVVAHGGALTLASEAGRGTTVTVT